VVDQLTAALSSFPPTPDSDDVAKLIAPQVPDIEPEDLTDILDTIYAPYYVREVSDIKLSRFLNDLIQTFRTSPDPHLAVTDDDEAGRVRARFKKLLSIENIGLLSKAMRLQRDGERLYCEAKILSDLRAVFHDDVSSRPAGAVLTHTLKLSYHENGDHKDFFIILESQDLERLRKIVEGAQAKELTLRTLLDEAKLQDLSI
jgi:hypothetical protein